MDNICAHATTQGRWKGPMFPTGNNPHFRCGTWGEHWGLTEDCCPFCVWCRIPGGGILFFYGILSDGERSGLQAGHLLHICGLKAHWLDWTETHVALTSGYTLKHWWCPFRHSSCPLMPEASMQTHTTIRDADFGTECWQAGWPLCFSLRDTDHLKWTLVQKTGWY